MKKILSVVLAVMMIFGSFAINASAAESADIPEEFLYG